MLAFMTIGALGIGTSDAALVVYTDRALWEAQLGTINHEDFNGFSTGNLGTNRDFGPFNLRFSGNIGGPTGNSIDPGVADETPPDLDIDDSVFWHGHVDTFLFKTVFPRIEFDLPVFAFGADWTSTTNEALLTLIANETTVEFDNHMPASGDGFLGIIDSNPFTEVFINNEKNGGAEIEVFGADNFSFSHEMSVVPEPSTLVMLLMAVAGGAVTVRRKRSRM